MTSSIPRWLFVVALACLITLPVGCGTATDRAVAPTSPTAVGEEFAPVSRVIEADLDGEVTKRPPLTSVDLGSAARARIAAELLLERIEGLSDDPRMLGVEPRLVVRASSGAAG